jgi:hypothetical protein
MSRETNFPLAEMLNRANERYQDGFLSEYFDPATGEPRDGEGDTLAEFIVKELRDTFDPNASRETQIEEAQRVLSIAIADLELVIEAFE